MRKTLTDIGMVLVIVLNLVSCSKIKPEDTSNTSYGNLPVHGIAEVTVDGQNISPYEHVKTMREEFFDIMTNDELYGYKVVLTPEQIASLPEKRRMALQNALEPLNQGAVENSVKFYRQGKEVSLAEALTNYSSSEIKSLFSEEARKTIIDNLNPEKWSSLSIEQQSALNGE